MFFNGDADMPLIADIIKKYETQNAASRAVDKTQYAANREDIFLKVQPRGDPTGEQTIGLGLGSIWKAKPIKLNPPAPVVKQTQQIQKPTIEQELERLRKENQELKQKLQQLNYA